MPTYILYVQDNNGYDTVQILNNYNILKPNNSNVFSDIF